MSSNNNDPIDGLETAASEIATLQERLATGEHDPSPQELAAIGKAAWTLVDALRAVVIQPLPSSNPARERPIMLGRRGIARV